MNKTADEKKPVTRFVTRSALAAFEKYQALRAEGWAHEAIETEYEWKTGRLIITVARAGQEELRLETEQKGN